MENYPREIENLMKRYYETLNEKDRRRFAALEVFKLGWGAQQYIAEVLDIDPKTISRGMKELKEGSGPPPGIIRKEGGGRKKIIHATENIDEVFLRVIDNYTAGDPMNEKVKWTNLTRKEISEIMTEEGVKVSEYVVKQLLKKHGFVRRKASKKKP